MSGRTKGVRKQKTDRQDAQLILSGCSEMFSADLGADLGKPGSAATEELVEYQTKRRLLVLLHALESLFKLRDQRCFAGLETVASHHAPEKSAARVMCIVHGQ